MVLTEKDLEQFKQKVVLDCGYFKDEFDNVSVLGMTPYYDLGEGFLGDFKEEKETISNYKEKSFPFEAPLDKSMFLKELYAKGLKNGYPIFVRLGEDFFFLNEFKFFKPNQTVTKKLKELGKLMDKNVREDKLVRAETLLYKLKLTSKF